MMIEIKFPFISFFYSRGMINLTKRAGWIMPLNKENMNIKMSHSCFVSSKKSKKWFINLT